MCNVRFEGGEGDFNTPSPAVGGQAPPLAITFAAGKPRQGELFVPPPWSISHLSWEFEVSYQLRRRVTAKNTGALE